MTTLRKLLILPAILFAVIFIISCKSSKHSSKRLPGVWQVSPITVDGNNKDWPSPYPEYDEKAMLGYAVSNDKENLYITVETGDLATQLKILKNGLTVWIDRKGEKGEVTAINYPIPVQVSDDDVHQRPARGQAQQGQGSGGGGSTQDRQRIELEDRVRKMLPDANEYSLQGFKGCNLQYPIMEKDSCGVIIRLGIDDENEMVWEAVVPFRAFYFKSEITRADKGRPISLCFETTGSKRPPGQPGSHGGGGGGGMRPGVGVGMGGMGMGMRMGGGGGGRGRSAPQTNNMMESLYKSTKTYKKFGVAFE